MKPDTMIWRSGYVRRWHNNGEIHLRESGDNTGWHSQRVALLITMLHPLPSAHLLKCALTHDIPEIVTGDVPGPAKVGFLGEALKLTEESVSEHLQLPIPLNKTDAAWLAMCDRLDAYLWVREHANYLTQTPEWQDALEGIYISAQALDVLEKVKELVD